MKDERVMQACWLVLATRACPPVGNEAGMCPGINGFTKCAPIADWSGRAKENRRPAAASGGGIGVAHTWRCLPCCAFGGRSSRLAHIAKGDLCATRPCGQGRCETTKSEIRKTNLECPLESMR